LRQTKSVMPNSAFERTDGSRALAAAAQRGC
jgi:hypothetical protein